MRQMLDNLYLQNNARTEIPETAIGDYTIDDYLNPRPGGVIRTSQPGMMREIVPTPVIDQALAAIEFMNTVRENRTGVTKYNQGLDAETLNKTARGIQQIMDASREKIALIARVFAETGVSSLFRRIHRLLQMHSRKALTVRLRGKWVEVDPRQWSHRMDMTVSVGLGTGDRDQQLMHLTTLAQMQKEALMGQLPIVTPKNIYNTAVKMAEIAGFKSPELFWTNPDEEQGGEEKPDPAQQALQAQVEVERAKIESEMAMKREELALKREEMMRQDDRERDKLEADVQLRARELELKYLQAVETANIQAMMDRDRQAQQAGVALQRGQSEDQLAREQAQRQDMLAREQGAMQDERSRSEFEAKQKLAEQQMQARQAQQAQRPQGVPEQRLSGAPHVV